jgi:hypothetical protein
MTAYGKPLPSVDDPLTAAFWSASREERLVAQRCGKCGYLRWPPGPICNECLEPGGAWTDVSPTGVLYSYAEYHRALDPAFADDVPYTVGLIELDDGPRMYGMMHGTLTTADVGGRVHAVFDPVTPEVTFVRWRLLP